MKPSDRTGNEFSPTTSPQEDVVAALLYLYNLQTNEEKIRGTTGADNGVGFSAYDAPLLTSISEYVLAKGTITERQLQSVRFKLQRYKKQLSDADLDKHRIEFKTVQYSPTALKFAEKEKTAIAYNDTTIKLEFGYDESLIARVKLLSGRKYNAQGKFWTCPADRRNINSIENMGFTCPPEFLYLLQEKEIDLDFDGLVRELRPYQIQGATRAARELELRALIADDMGLGKTAQALAAIWARRDIAFPALVICPGSLKWNWAREVSMWLPGVSVRVLNGYTERKSYKPRTDMEITIINYDILANRGYKRALHGWADLLRHSGFQTVIMDECHKIKNYKAKRTKAIIEMVEDIPYRLALSGTPIESRPMEFWTTLKIVSPQLFPNFWEYGNRYCGAVTDAFGTKFNGASNLQELNGILTENVMIRRRKSDVLKELPPKVRSVIPVEIDMRQYHKMENDLRSFIQDVVGHSPKDKQASVLAQMEKCKQAAILGKLDCAKEYIENYLESGRKLVVFATHTFTLDHLEKAFSHCSVRIDGSVTGIKRQQAVDRFQGDDSCRLFLGNIQAAGVGLTLTAASDTLTLELSWTPGIHEQAEDRVHRIGQEADSVNAYYMIAVDTIEMDMMEIIDEKRKVLSQVLDGVEVSMASLLTELCTRVVARGDTTSCTGF